MLDFKLIKKSLSGLFSEECIFLYELTDSTNTRALEYGRAGGITPAVFIAEEQTGGRGRRGRSFVSRADGGIFITFLLSPDDVGGIEGATAFAAVAAREALLECCGVSTGIKWVNDLYAKTPSGDNKKLVGILAESVIENSEITKIAIGMGINVYKNAISEEISEIATSFEEVAGERFSRENIILSLTQSLLKKRTPEQVLSEYRKSSITLGKSVVVSPHGKEPYPALAKEILADYSLLVENESGELLRIFSGEVSTKITKEANGE